MSSQAERSHRDEADKAAAANSVPTLSTVDEGTATAIAGPDDSPYKQLQYSLDDILESSREGQDESAVIESLESTKSVSKSSMLPSMSDDFLMNTLQEGNNNDEEEKKKDNDPNINYQSSQEKSHRSSSHSNNNDLSEISRKLEASPWMRGQQNSGTANLTHKDPSQISSFDLFCNNASKLLPSQKISSKHVTEDPVSTRADPNIDDGDVENQASSRQMHENGESPNDDDEHCKSNSQALQGLKNLGQKTKSDVFFFVEFLEPYRSTLRSKFLKVIFYALLPCLAIASILYYGTGNPPTGTAWVLCTDGTSSRGIRPSYVSTYQEGSNSTNPNEEWCIDENKSLAEASVSWWFLFIARQIVTFCLATFMQLIIIDFFTFRTKVIRNIVGTHASLTIAASKGWPFILFMWAIFNFILLYGSRNFSRHWLYWQKYVGLFNAGNPSGNITDKPVYKNILYVSVGLSVAVAIKRALMGIFVGKRVVSNYRNQLSTVIKRNMLLSEVAAFSVTLDSRNDRKSILRRYDEMQAMYVKPLERNKDAAETIIRLEDSTHSSKCSESTFNVNSTRKSTEDNSFQNGIAEMLDEWDDPVLEAGKQHAPKMTDVLYFRRAIDFIDGRYPFSPSFGRAGTRVECIESAQRVFDRLKTNRRESINFEKLKQLATEDNLVDQGKLQELVKVFRPNKDGEISKLDFVKSCDSVYKSLKLFLANVNNSSQIDHAYEKIINIAFYAIALFVILAVFGVDINALFILLSSILISFAFMIQSASSKYLEGILLVLVRKPYDVGDRIVLLDPNAAVDNFGPPSGGWVVEKVDLYTTTVRLGTTREYCTFSNGSLANSRILNLNRTDKPNIFHYVKVTLDVTQEQLDTFRQEVIQFVKDRPRSWIKIVNIRCDSIETEMQYLQYVIIIQHREKWQSFLAIQIDQGEVFVFCQKLMRKLGMNYTAPKMPIELVGGRTQKTLHNYVAGEASMKVDDMYGHTSSLDIDETAPYEDKNKNI